MAITKIIGAIHSPKAGGSYKVLGNTINYILNPAKTADGLYTGGINCFPETALKEMIATKEHFGKTPENGFGKQDRLGYHFTVSFSPEERVPPDTAVKVMQDFSQELLGNEYEAVYGVHVDQEHIHGHLCFNSVNLNTGLKWRYDKGDWAEKIQPLTDKICKKYGLHTLEMDTGISIEEYEKHQKEKEKKQKQGERKHGNQYHKDREEHYSWNEHLRNALDAEIPYCSSYEELEKKLREKGFSMKYGTSEKYGNYVGMKAPGMGVYRKTYQLGREYTLTAIKERIGIAAKPLPAYQKMQDKILIIPICHYVRLKRLRLSAAMRRYYARLYRLGIRPRKVKISYQDVKAAREHAEEIQLQLSLVLKYHIGSSEGALAAVAECKEEYRLKQQDAKQFKERHAPYAEMVRRYRAYVRLEKRLELIEEEDMQYEYLRDRLTEAERAYQKYGFSKEQIENYLAGRKQEERDVRRKLKEAELNLAAATAIANEFMSEPIKEEEFSEEIKQFYDIVPETRQKDITISKQLIAETGEHAVKTRVPGTWGKNVRYLWIPKEEIMDVYKGETMLTSLNLDDEYTLYDDKNQEIEKLRGEQLYCKHYDEVRDGVREYYEQRL